MIIFSGLAGSTLFVKLVIMEILSFNAGWMIYNLFLALLGLGFGWAFWKVRWPVVKMIFFLLWLFFVPNTIYILTDVIYVGEQLAEVDPGYWVLLVAQYIVFLCLGILLYVAAVYPFEKFVRSKFRLNRHQALAAIAVLNFFISVGVMMGRFQRTNSWEVVTNTRRAIDDALQVVTSVELMVYVLAFAALITVIYMAGMGFGGSRRR